MDGPGVTVNGRRLALDGIPVHTTLLDFVRDAGLTGCKEGCAEGECGACAVLVARPGVAAPAEWTAVNSCLLPAAALDGQDVITAEGLGQPDALHPVQREMAVRGGSQCGYCTPGFVCAMAAEYYRPDRDGFDLHALSGNLCRCTGYRPIRDAARALGPPAAPVPATGISRDGRAFVRPATLPDALRELAGHPGTVPVAGCTDWGVEVNLRGRRAGRVMAIDRLPELRELTIGDDAIELGATLTLTEMERRLDGRVPLLAGLFPQFASRLIRNGATLGGNLGTGSPIGDAAPALLALDASVVLVSAAHGEREVPLDGYFTGYRTSVRRPDELIKSVRVPLPLAPVTAFHKVAKRRFDDISSVAAGFALDITGGVVQRARVGLGGVAATPVRGHATEAALEGQPWTFATVAAAADVLRTEGTPLDDHRASARYRTAMLGQSLARLYAETTGETTAETAAQTTEGVRA